MRALKLQHDEDPKTVLQRRIGDISWFRIFGPKLLVATYDPGGGGGNAPKEVKTQGGIIVPQTASSYKTGGPPGSDDSYQKPSSLDEFKWQGKVGLVVAIGPGAFQDSPDGRFRFYGMKVELYDWVVYRASDGDQMMLEENHARVLDDSHIVAVIPDPDKVY